MGRRRAVAVTAAAALLLAYGALVALVAPRGVEGASGPLRYRLDPDDDEREGRDHVVAVTAWADGRSAAPTVTLRYRDGAAGPFQARALQRLPDGRTFAGSIPPVPPGHRVFYYLEVRGAGAEARVPAGAPDGPLLHVRWERAVNPFLLALHITLMVGALFFLVHAVHYAARSARLGGSLAGKAHAGLRWGWLCFAVGGIPLGIVVSGTAFGWSRAWGGWPLGGDVTDTKTEALALYWAVVLLLRADLFPAVGPRVRPLVSDRVLSRLALAGAGLTAVVYAIPHSYFSQ